MVGSASITPGEILYLRCLQSGSAVQCAVQRKYFDDLWTEITLQAGLVLGAAVRPSWLRHYTKNLYLYNVSITASSTLCSVTPQTQMGAEKILQFSSQPSPALT